MVTPPSLRLIAASLMVAAGTVGAASAASGMSTSPHSRTALAMSLLVTSTARRAFQRERQMVAISDIPVAQSLLDSQKAATKRHSKSSISI